MAEAITLARPYAKAAFALARQTRAQETWSKQLQLLAELVSHPKAREILVSPKLTSAQRAQWVIDLLGDELNPALRNLVKLLSDYDRLEVLPDIAALFEYLKAVDENSIDVELRTPKPVDEAYTAKLTGLLRDRLGKAVHLHIQIDLKLIGGAIIQAGDTVIDGSVQGRLQRLAQDLVHQ